MQNFEFNKTLGSDNHAGVHPQILQALANFNVSHSHSYGADSVTKKTERLFKEFIHPNAETIFVFNGTAANVIAISPLLKPYEAVLCTEISHLNRDECGAPERILGCKLITVSDVNGKIDLNEAEQYCIRKGDQHYAQPRVLSITQPTEVGTCYSLDELEVVREFCNRHSLKLHIDGARFCYAPHFLKCTAEKIINTARPDSLSYGGTKNGLLYGEAVMTFDSSIKDMKFYRKQLMQLPSKMRFLAAQFLTFFENELFQSVPSHGHSMAQLLQSQVKHMDEIQIKYPVEANSVFPKIPQAWTKSLKQEKFFYVWDEHEWVMRWMCSFDTTEKDIESFTNKLSSLASNKI